MNQRATFRFVSRMARREMRASWRRLLFFFLCIGIGVAAIVALRSTIGNVRLALVSEARTLLGADATIESTRPWEQETLQRINRIAEEANVEARAETIEAPTMIRTVAVGDAGGAVLAELKGVDEGFPVVGEWRLTTDENITPAMLANNGVVVAPLVLERLNVKVGDQVAIGTGEFQIRGVTTDDPGGGSSGFRLGPRVFVQQAAIETSGLGAFGNRARRRILFRTPVGTAERFAQQLRDGTGDSLIRVRSYKDAEERLSNQFDQAEDYLALTGLIVLVLGGVGISNVLRVLLEQKRQTIAVLKCVGATGRQVTFAYLAQTLLLGVAGSLCGVLLAQIALLLVEYQFAASLPSNMRYGLRPEAIGQGILLGLLVTLLFSLAPLLRVRSIKPRLLLRGLGETDAGSAQVKSNFIQRLRSSFDATRWGVNLVAAAGLVGIAAWQAGSLRVGGVFLVALAVTAGVLYLLAGALVRLLRGLTRRSTTSSSRQKALTPSASFAPFAPFALRQAINSLHRPGNQTRVIVMAIGLGVFLVIGVWSLQTSLLREFDLSRRGSIPDMFLIDIQQDQAAGVRDYIVNRTGTQPTLVPTVRARIKEVNGKPVDIAGGAVQRERGRLGREYVVTYRPNLETNERITGGRFWEPTASAEPEVSLEESMKGIAGIDIGSTVTFDVLGQEITARVTSFRHVDWRNSRTGFMVLFRPGVLEDAPQVFVGATNAPADAAERARFQRGLLDRFPNVSVIDVGEIVRTISEVLRSVSLAVSFIGGFIVFSGVLILSGSIAMTKFQRVYEAAVLRTLGARRATLLTILFTEYSLLGFVAGLIGSLAGVALSFAAARYIFKIEWAWSPLIFITGIFATVLLTVIVGAVASLDVLQRKPLAILRGG